MPIAINGSGTITGISVGGIPDGTVDTDVLAANAVTFDKIGTTEQGQLCKAWVNFDGTASGTFAGGASTVTRVASSTTATVTTTNAHGLITGNTVYALTGVAAGSYTVTVLTSTTFTITTVATTALSAVSITFAVNSIRASYNVSSIADNGVGDYTVNFTTAMVDANYCAVFGGARASSEYILGATYALTTTSVKFNSVNTTVAQLDVPNAFVAIFR